MTRDHARTPFQWDATMHAGFSSATPWLPVNPNHAALNATAQAEEPHSILAFVKALIALRNRDPLWVFGAFADLAPDEPDVFVYTRTHAGRSAVVALNLCGHEVKADLPRSSVELSNYAPPYPLTALRPWEARIYTTDGAKEM